MARQIIIYVTDKSSELNHKLMTFLEKNLPTTAKCGNHIIPRIMHNHKLKEFYKKFGIDKLPASIFNGQKHIGTKKIKDLIKSLCKNQNVQQQKSQKEFDSEELLTYQNHIMRLNPNGEDSDEDNDGQFDQNMAKGLAARQRDQQSYGFNHNGFDQSMDDMGGNAGGNADGNAGNLTPINSTRPDNIETFEDISAIAHTADGGDFDQMDAFLEKIGGSNIDGGF